MSDTELTYLDEQRQLEHIKDFMTLWNEPEHKYRMLVSLALDVSEYEIFQDPEVVVEHEFFAIRGGLIINEIGYRYDGPSGPTKDDETNMRAALFHDIGYQAFEMLKHLSYWKRFRLRRALDKIFRRTLKADGMGFIRRQGYFVAVRGFGAFFAYFMLFLVLLTTTGCQNQVNLASSVVNITVIKIQYAEDDARNEGMSGSDIKDPRNDQKGGDAKLPVP